MTTGMTTCHKNDSSLAGTETNMIANRMSKLEDHVAASRRLKVIFVPTLVALLAGFLISFAVSPRYTSKSLVLVERSTAPATSGKSAGTASVRDRMATLQQQVLSRSRLQALVNRRSDLASGGKSVDDVIDQIQSAASVTEAPAPGSSEAGSSAAGSSATSPSNSATRGGDFVGFYISFTANTPHDAQQLCSEVTSMLLEENLRSDAQTALGASDFLSRQLNEAKSNLDQTDQKLVAFKTLYAGQLPGDVENNLKVLGGLNSQLDAVTWQLNRAQQDKSYAESVLAQQLAAWKSYRSSSASESTEQQLAAMKTQLVTLQARYTDDHPDVIKLKSDIAELEAKQKETSPPSDPKTGVADASGKAEPPEILQLRQEIDQNARFIAKATHEQKQLAEMISVYQSRLTVSPKVEEEYKQLTRDNETASKIYDSLLLKKSDSEIQTGMEYRKQAEQMQLLDAASLPASPSFPVRWKFAACGLGAGLTFGIAIAMWLELRHKAIRNEDTLARLERPMPAPIPIASPVPIEGQRGFRGRLKALLGQKRTAGG